VEGRLELVRQTGRTLVYTDEAFHPIAVKPLLETLRKQHRGRRLVVILEPRFTGGLHGHCQKEFPDCLQSADVVLVSPPREVIKFDDLFDHHRLCRQLRKKGVRALPLSSVAEAAHLTPPLCREGDVIVISLSVGNDELIERICDGIQEALLRKK
jgi:UDP-N-acetylmuramate: L-alanyl-gamma-D-glutamyl-meso-diaminopimelate ligase